MDNVTKVWRLDSPSMCRDFLKQLRLRDKDGREMGPITEVTQDGKTISIDDADDEAIMDLAREFARAL